jgi:hypothetical protein
MQDYVHEDERPKAPDAETAERWEEQARRLHMQFGTSKRYVQRRMSEFFNQVVIERIESGIDLSSNTFKLANEKKSILYDVAATASFKASDKDRAALDLEVLWATRQFGHLVTNACNDSVLRLDWDADRLQSHGTGVSYRVVTPDNIDLKARDSVNGGVACYAEETRWRKNPFTGKRECTLELWDLRDPANPYFVIRDKDRKRDLTLLYMPELADPKFPGGPVYAWSPKGDAVRLRGDWWPYVDDEGPIFPYIGYHLRLRPEMWDWRSRSEIVDGTLTSACLRTWFVSGIRDLAHPQRAAIDLQLPTAAPARGRTEINRVELDQSAILMFKSAGAAPGLHTLDPAMDPAVALDAIERFNASLLETDGLGIEPTNTSRMSGYAIVVSRDSLRKVQRQQTPAARQGDQLTLATAARLLNAYQGTRLPVKPADYGVGYHGVELSLEELRSRLEEMRMLREAGLITRKRALMLVEPQLSPEEAERRLEEIDAELGAVPAEKLAEVVELLDQAAEEAIALADGDDLSEAAAAKLRAVLQVLGRAVAMLDGGNEAPNRERTGAPTPKTLTDPSTGAPLRTPRGLSVTTSNREEEAAAGAAHAEAGEKPDAPRVDDAPVPAEASAVADLSMNGAQIAELFGVAEKVASGLIPYDTAVVGLTLAYPAQIDKPKAEAFLSAVKNFKPATPPPAAKPPFPPKKQEPDPSDEGASP